MAHTCSYLQLENCVLRPVHIVIKTNDDSGIKYWWYKKQKNKLRTHAINIFIHKQIRILIDTAPANQNTFIHGPYDERQKDAEITYASARRRARRLASEATTCSATCHSQEADGSRARWRRNEWVARGTHQRRRPLADLTWPRRSTAPP